MGQSDLQQNRRVIQTHHEVLVLVLLFLLCPWNHLLSIHLPTHQLTMLTCLDPACTRGTVQHSTTPTYVLAAPSDTRFVSSVLGPTPADVVGDTADGADDNNDDDDATDAFGLVAEDHVLIERQCTWDTTVQAHSFEGLFSLTQMSKATSTLPSSLRNACFMCQCQKVIACQKWFLVLKKLWQEFKLL